MKIIDYLISLNSVPYIKQDIYTQQIIQTYKELQDINNAKKINIQREHSVSDIYKSGTENHIRISYKINEKYNQNSLRNSSVEKETYEISFTKFRFKKNYNKGSTIDIVI